MIIKQLDVHRLRNLSQLRLHPDPAFNIITGDNGSGKSSLLEAIYLLAVGRSFRTNKTDNLIQFQQNDFALFCRLTDQQQIVDIPIGLQRSKNKSPTIHISGEKQQSLAVLSSYLPVLFMSPDSIQLLSTTKLRRQYLDWGVFHVEHSYIKYWKLCSRLIKQRNIALKQARRYQDIQHWDVQLQQLAETIHQLRENYVQQIIPYVEARVSSLLQLTGIEIRYKPGWNTSVELASQLAENFNKERQIGFTLLGPHKADIKFNYHSKPAAETLSRGQQKLLIIALRLAQSELLYQRQQRSAIILIDDLAAELDSQKQQNVLQHLTANHNQTFITAAQHSELFQQMTQHACKMFHVEQGSLV